MRDGCGVWRGWCGRRPRVYLQSRELRSRARKDLIEVHGNTKGDEMLSTDARPRPVYRFECGLRGRQQ